MGRLFKSYYDHIFDVNARTDIEDITNGSDTKTTESSTYSNGITITRPRRESQSRASNSDPSDSEQDIQSQSQSRHSESDIEMSDPDEPSSSGARGVDEDDEDDAMNDQNIPSSQSDEAERRAFDEDEADESSVDTIPLAHSVSGEDQEEAVEEISAEEISPWLPTNLESSSMQRGNDSGSESDIVILNPLQNESSILSRGPFGPDVKERLRKRVLKSRLEGDEDIFVCKFCGTHITHKNDLIDRKFKGKTGKASLFVAAMNVVPGPREKRNLTSGSHECSDVHCAMCGNYLGWTYFKADDKENRYKIGTYCFEGELVDTEQCFLTDANEERNSDFFRQERKDMMCMDDANDDSGHRVVNIRSQLTVNSLQTIANYSEWKQHLR